MTKEEQVKKLTDYMAKFIAYTAKKLPDDVIAKLQELREKEDSPLSKTIYNTMFENQKLAVELSEAGSGIEPSKLSGYRSIAVLGKMWNKIPTYRRTGSTVKGSRCTGDL